MIPSSVKALLVEHEARRAECISEMLDNASAPSIEVERADSLQSGLERFGQETFDVVVIRLHLPDSKGLEALVRFHLVNESAPVIVIIEDEEQEVVLDAAQSLADDCLFWNDLDEESIVQAIRYALDRRQMLQELRQRQSSSNSASNRAPYRTLIDHIDEALFVVSKQDRGLLHANDVARTWFGGKIGEVLADLLEYQLIDSDDLEMEISTSWPAIPSAELRSVSLVWKDQDVCMITLRNISKRKRAEEAFLSSQRRLELALNASNIGLWSWDLRANQLKFSDRWKSQLGYESHEFSDTLSSFKNCLHPDDRRSTIELFKRYLREPWPDFECEYRMENRDGAYRDILCRAEIITDKSGRPSKLMGSHIDITARKKQESAQALFEKHLLEYQRMESMGIIAGGMAHSLNNLMTAMMGNAALVRLEIEDSSIACERIEKLEQSARMATELCQKMLSYSGKGALAIQSTDLNSVVGECRELIELALPENAMLETDLADGRTTIPADPSEIKQLVLNLTKNASEALADSSNGLLRVKTGKAELDQAALVALSGTLNAQPGEYVYFEVNDNGHGISTEVLERVFDPFFTTKFQGRGLGLAAVQGIVQSHKGAFDLQSDEAGGTCFKVYFPVASSYVAPTGQLVEEVSVAKKILVVDDEDILRLVIANMLTSFGCEPVIAKDGEQALEIFEKSPGDFSLVIVDMNMPGIDGGEVYRQLRSQRKDLPIILMSGDNDEVAIPFESVDRGRCQFLHKPFGMDQLKQSMSQLMSVPVERFVSA